MNQTEAVSLVGYLNRAGLLQVLDGQGRVWADALDDVAFTDAQTVARALGKTRTGAARWVTPGDIREGVQTVRRRRIADMPTPQPPESIPADDTATERAWVRAYTTAIGDGHDEPTADRIACATVDVVRPAVETRPRPVAQLVQQTTDAMHRIPQRAS